MDFLLARLDQLEKDRLTLIQENQALRNELNDEKIKVRLLTAKNEIIEERQNEEYLNSKN
jgi:cell division protein FtsB|tara:strand:- start:459 stop:638 length:180 start_codon:yes stop_codon:yes gene_type:complete